MKLLSAKLAILSSRPELAIVALMTLVIAMLIIPLPPWLIDFLIAANLAVAMTVFVSSFYVNTVTEYSAFPAVLLITTLFRLALSISTSRMILIEADAGAIVSSFGDFVIGGDLLVGLTIFFIVTLVQFLVITKGAERVAEVCARFTLDGLPGKQMSIDADLRANVIDGNQARRLRGQLEKESQLYGSLDGAIKFVKGDAIAGIVIIFVNMIGGMSVGMMRHGLSFSGALHTYTVLTIGDGLVAQIPALLIAVAAGFIVTRVKDDDQQNLGHGILSQVFGRTDVLAPVAVLCACVAFLPGFPSTVFLLIGALLAAICVRRTGWANVVAMARGRPPATVSGGAGGAVGGGSAVGTGPAVARSMAGTAVASAGSGTTGDATAVHDLLPETLPLALLLPADAQAQAALGADIGARLEREFFLRLGIKLPPLEIRSSPHVPADTVMLLINEVRAASLRIGFGRRKIVEGADTLLALAVPLTELRDAGGRRSYWIDPTVLADVPAVDTLVHHSDADELVRLFELSAARHVTEYFGIQETRNLLDELESKYPELLKETYRNAPIQRIAAILQRLVAENVSVRNLKVILETLAQWAPRERDNILLAEHVRGALARYITDKFSRGRKINTLLMQAPHEELIRNSIAQTSTGAFLQMNEADADLVLGALRAWFDSSYAGPDDVILMTSVDIRRFARVLVEPHFPDLQVMSLGELSDQSMVNVLATV